MKKKEKLKSNISRYSKLRDLTFELEAIEINPVLPGNPNPENRPIATLHHYTSTANAATTVVSAFPASTDTDTGNDPIYQLDSGPQWIRDWLIGPNELKRNLF